MNKLTVAGFLIAITGFGVGATGFVLMAVSGEIAFEVEIEKGNGRGAVHAKSFEVELGPEMNPLAIDITSGDLSSGVEVTLADAAGAEVFRQSRSGPDDATGGGSWFFSPIVVENSGRHTLACRLWSRDPGAVAIRRNIVQFPIVTMFVAIFAAIAGVGLVVIPPLFRRERSTRPDGRSA